MSTTTAEGGRAVESRPRPTASRCDRILALIDACLEELLTGGDELVHTAGANNEGA